MEVLTEWLFKQGSLVVILGVVLFILSKWTLSLYGDLKEKDNKIAELNKEMNRLIGEMNEKTYGLAEKVIVTATMSEARLHSNTEDQLYIKKLLIEIKEIVKNIRK